MYLKNNPKILLLIILIFIAHPAMTEHVEFALSYIKLVDFSEHNTFFNARSSEYSSQIIFPAILLKFGISSGLIQLLMSLILSSIITITEVLIFKFFLERIKFDLNKNLFNIISILVILMLFVKPNNISLYPWSPIIYFFEFGNAGLWMVLLVTFCYLNDQINKTRILSAIIIFWHPVWGAANALYFLIFDRKIILNKFFFIILIIQILILFSLGITFNNSNNHILQFKKIQDDIFTAHNPILSYNFTEFFSFVFLNLFPIILFLFILNKDKTNYKNLFIFIYYYLLLSIILLLYVEVARYIELPFSQIIFRGIPNRYLNFIHVIITLGSIVYLYRNIIYSFKKSNLIYNLICLCILLIVVGHKSTILIIFICCFLSFTSSINKIIISLFFILYSLFFYKNYSSTPYNSLSEFISSDPIINFLAHSNNKGGYILSSRVQSYKGLNVGTLSKSQYYLPMKTIVNGIDLYCSNLKAENFNAMNDNADNCFSSRSADEWNLIGKALDVRYVITNSNVILNLKLILNSNGFNVYEIN